MKIIFRLIAYQQVEGRKEINILFTDVLNIFYLWLYCVKHIVKDHSDKEKGNQPVVSISSKGQPLLHQL